MYYLCNTCTNNSLFSTLDGDCITAILEYDNLSSFIHIDMSLNHDLDLLNHLFHLNETINEVTENVITTTNTIDQDIKQVHMEILLVSQSDQFDILTYLFSLLQEFERRESVITFHTYCT